MGGLLFPKQCSNNDDDRKDNHQYFIITHETSPPSSSVEESGSNASRYPFPNMGGQAVHPLWQCHLQF